MLEELDLPYQQILAGLEFGLDNVRNVAMNPNGLVPLLKDNATGVVFWESNTIIRYLAAEYGIQASGWPGAARARGKVDGFVQRHPLTPPSPGINGPGENAGQRDPAAIAAGISACKALFAMLDDELAKTPWLSGEQFGLGDIAVAPSVYDLLSILDSWQPRPHLQRWYQQISQRPAWCEVVQMPVT